MYLLAKDAGTRELSRRLFRLLDGTCIGYNRDMKTFRQLAMKHELALLEPTSGDSRPTVIRAGSKGEGISKHW